MGIKMCLNSTRDRVNVHSVGRNIRAACPNCGTSLRAMQISSGAIRVWCPGCSARPVESDGETVAISSFVSRGANASHI